MIQSAAKLLTVDEFITQYGDSPDYELIDGELINIEATGLHEQVVAFMGRKLNVEIDRQNIPFACFLTLTRIANASYSSFCSRTINKEEPFF